MADVNRLFSSYIQAGFECSTHRNRAGKQLDLLESTGHDRLTLGDYERLRAFGITTIRTAAKWYRIEETARQYDFSSLRNVLTAARTTGMEVILDLLHFGWPGHIDVFSSKFPDEFARFTEATVRFLRKEFAHIRFIAPVNEVSYLSWAGGEVGCIGPYEVERGHEFKQNLIRAAVCASEVLLQEHSAVRLISQEPVIHIIGDPAIPGDEEQSERYSKAMFEAWDMLSGRMHPELGGRPEYLDLIGINFYERNQWINNSLPITRDHPKWRPLSDILREVWDRYQRPMFIAETGTEDEARPGWLHYVCEEVREAVRFGIPVHGICLYPILNHPGWDDDRHCCNGLFDYADQHGNRPVYEPLADALLTEQKRLNEFFEETNDSISKHGSDLPVASAMGLRVSATAAPDEQVCPRT